MRKYAETLYWKDFKDKMHFNPETDEVTWDEDTPERVKKSYESWREAIK